VADPFGIPKRPGKRMWQVEDARRAAGIREEQRFLRHRFPIPRLSRQLADTSGKVHKAL